MLDYANRLVVDGYQVEVVYAAYNKFMNWGLAHRLLYRLLYIKQKIRRTWLPRWMSVDERVKQMLVFTLEDYHYSKSAIYVATAVDTAMSLKNYKVPDSQKYYFIQDLEVGYFPIESVRETFRLSMCKLVVSRWLQREVEHQGGKAVFVPNGFDFNKFYVTIPAAQRDSKQIAFMYHIDKRKDIGTAFEAFRLVAQKHPDIHLAVFSAYDAPTSFPVKATFVQQPDDETFLRLYNTSAIYVGASEKEGWGLTVGEAMQCGCAVACTDNKGYLEMAHDGETALVSPVGDAEALAENICRLIEDKDLRLRIAKNGENFIHKFDIEASYQKFKSALTQWTLA